MTRAASLAGGRPGLVRRDVGKATGAFSVIGKAVIIAKLEDMTVYTIILVPILIVSSRVVRENIG